jgi:hypothetical protein
MDQSFDNAPTNRRKRAVIRLLAVVGIVALVLPMIWAVVYQQLLAPRPAPPIEVVVRNDTDATYIVWGSTDPSPVPSGDYDLERRGFEVAARAVVWLPSDRNWDPVSVWTADCALVTEDVAPTAPGYVVEIEANGDVRVTRDQPQGERLAAPPTDRCVLVPFTPSP